MPKNKLGGNRAKKMGRKYSQVTIQKKTRYSKNPDEIYACCDKIYGGSQISILCSDGKSRLCFIRNKFRGRGRRDNQVSIGSWLLVGRREYETTKKGLEKCDLLEVYNEYDQRNLEQNEVQINWNIFKTVGQIESSIAIDNSIVFTDDTEENNIDDSVINDLVNNTNKEKDTSTESDIDMDEI